MDLSILKARGSYWFLVILIAIQFIVLLSIGVLLIQTLVREVVSIMTIVSYVVMVLVCLPLSVFLYRTTSDHSLKKIFRSLTFSLALLTVSGILWDIVPVTFGITATVPIAKLLMVLSYVPFLATLPFLKSGPMKAPEHLRAIILFFNAISVVILGFFVAMNLLKDGGNAFDASVYGISAIADIVIISLSLLLAISFMQNQFRYAFLILIAYFIISLIGDSLNLLNALGLYQTMLYAQFSYDMMFILAAIALMIYSFSNIKITTVEEVNKKLNDTERLMGDIIMQSPDAICVFDARGDAVQANNAFIQVMCKQPSGLIGTLNIFRDADRLVEGSAAEIARMRDGGKAMFDGHKAVPVPDGETRFYKVKAFPAYGSDGTITSYILMMMDVTDYKSYEEKLVRARAQAELYLDLMSHDISNMNQIGIGFLEMALERMGPGDEGQMLLRKPLEAMGNSSHLIDNVKKIRRASMDAPGTGTVDLGEVLGEVVRDYHDSPGRDSIIEYSPVCGCYVRANSLLKDVFSNLIGNAFKHSTGPLKVWIKIVPLEQGGTSYYRVTIEDNGPGIPDEVKQICLNKAYPLRTRTQGSGLGLYLVTTLVESYKGTIAVEDRVPGSRSDGSRFILTLPAAETGRVPGTGNVPV